MKGEAPGSVMQVNISADVLKQVNTGGRQQRPKVLECFCYGGHAVQTIVDDDINLSFEALQRAFEWENKGKFSRYYIESSAHCDGVSRRAEYNFDMRIVWKLGAAFVHVDADDGASRVKILPEQFDRAAFFDADLFVEIRIQRRKDALQRNTDLKNVTG
jgi:hypothetical protein